MFTSTSRSTTRLLLAIATAVPSSTGVLVVATPAYAAPPADVIATVEDEVGTPEGSERADSYGAAVNLNASTYTYAWCAAFVSWVMERTGASGFRSASVGDWIAMAAAHDYGLSVTDRPRPGDLVVFDWDGDGDFAYPRRHMGFVASVPSDGGFTTIEGNTTLPSGGEGVAVRARSTAAGYSTLFIRIRVHSHTSDDPTTINPDPAHDSPG